MYVSVVWDGTGELAFPNEIRSLEPKLEIRMAGPDCYYSPIVVILETNQFV
jgi:hypothetical protein